VAFIFFDSCGDNLGTGTGALPGDWLATTNVTVSSSGFTGDAFTGATTATWSASVPNMSVAASQPFGFGMRVFIATSYPTNPSSIIQIGSNLGTLLNLNITPAGGLSLVNGPATSAAAITASTWAYVELWFPNGLFTTVGTGVPPVANIYVNGTLLVSGNYTGSAPNFPIATTLVGSNLGLLPGAISFFIDDFYCIDGTQSVNNAPLGPQIVKVASPSAAGRVTQFTPFGMTFNWQCVSITPPPGDTDYVTSTVVGTTDAYALSTVTGLSQLNGVKIDGNARQTVGGGGRTLNVGIGNGTLENYVQPQSLTTSYVMLPGIFNSNPFTASPWAVGDLTTLQAAIQIAS
jgi:hypothetical protein